MPLMPIGPLPPPRGAIDPRRKIEAGPGPIRPTGIAPRRAAPGVPGAPPADDQMVTQTFGAPPPGGRPIINLPRPSAPGPPRWGSPGQVGPGAVPAPGAAPGAGSAQDILRGLLGPGSRTGPGAGAVVPGGPVGSLGLPPSVTQTQYDPLLQRHAARLEERLSQPDVTTQRAIERAAGAIRDLGEGQQTAVREQFQRLGAEGGEAGGELEALTRIQEGIASGAARSAADISAQRERDIFGELVGATGALGAPGAAAARDREIALRQWSEAEAARRAQEALDIQREAQRIATIRGLWDMFPTSPVTPGWA